MCPDLALPDNCIKVTRTLSLVQREDALWAECRCGAALLVDYFEMRDMDRCLMNFCDEHGDCKQVKEQAA
ncbi:MAG TPA: hypothetical protein VFA10_17950 [Ktedonobacteraceae bacterium]|nr:hypothetical protein [Ktedonobacteraceae bacterium]